MHECIHGRLIVRCCVSSSSSSSLSNSFDIFECNEMHTNRAQWNGRNWRKRRKKEREKKEAKINNMAINSLIAVFAAVRTTASKHRKRKKNMNSKNLPQPQTTIEQFHRRQYERRYYHARQCQQCLNSYRQCNWPCLLRLRACNFISVHSACTHEQAYNKLTWYSAGPVCTESGVESFGGVGGNENKCWPLWWLCTIWPTLSCGSCGHANPHGLPGPNDFGSLNHGCNGAWKWCGRCICCELCDDDIRDAAALVFFCIAMGRIQQTATTITYENKERERKQNDQD